MACNAPDLEANTSTAAKTTSNKLTRTALGLITSNYEGTVDLSKVTFVTALWLQAKKNPSNKLGWARKGKAEYQWLGGVQLVAMCFMEVTLSVDCSLELLEPADAPPGLLALELADAGVPVISILWPT